MAHIIHCGREGKSSQASRLCDFITWCSASVMGQTYIYSKLMKTITVIIFVMIIGTKMASHCVMLLPICMSSLREQINSHPKHSQTNRKSWGKILKHMNKVGLTTGNMWLDTWRHFTLLSQGLFVIHNFFQPWTQISGLYFCPVIINKLWQ